MKNFRILLLSFIFFCFGALSSQCWAETYAFVPNFKDDTLSIANMSTNMHIKSISIDKGYGFINTEFKFIVGIAVSPVDYYVYLANREAGTLSIVDTSGVSTGLSVPVEAVSLPNPEQDDPIGVAVTPDGKYVYVANFGTDSVSVFETADMNSSPINIELGNGAGPMGIAISNSYGFVTNYNDGTVSVINTVTKALHSKPTINVGKLPVGVAVSPSGGQVYVTNFGDDTVSVIDTASMSELGIFTVDPSPVGVAVTPSTGSYVYVASRKNGTVQRIDPDYVDDPETDEAIKTIELGLTSAFGVSMAPTGEYVYVTGWDSENAGRIAVIDTSDIDTLIDPIKSLIPVGEKPVPLGMFIGEGRIEEFIAPEDLKAFASDYEQVVLAWDYLAADDLEGFEIWRKTTATDTITGTETETGTDSSTETQEETTYAAIAIVPSNARAYTDAGLTSNTTYMYKVRAFRFEENVDADSFDFSSAANLTTAQVDEYSPYSNEVEVETLDACFIATAAYGSLLEPQVETLRAFRDAYLLPNAVGQAFVRFYYTYSPPIADFIAAHTLVKALVRVALIPFIAVSHCALQWGLHTTLALFFIITALAISVNHRWIFRASPIRK